MTQDDITPDTKSTGEDLDTLRGKAENVAASFDDMTRRASASARALSAEMGSAVATLSEKFAKLTQEATNLRARLQELEALRGEMKTAAGGGDDADVQQVESHLFAAALKYQQVQRSLDNVAQAQNAASGRVGSLGVMSGGAGKIAPLAAQAFQTQSLRQSTPQPSARAMSAGGNMAALATQRQFSDMLPRTTQNYAGLSGRLTQETGDFKQQKSAIDELTKSVSSMATTLTNSVSQALVKSSGSGVTFKSVLAQIQTQTISLIAKLSVVNPLLNNIDGGTRGTLLSLAKAWGRGRHAALDAAGDFSGAGMNAGSFDLDAYFQSVQKANKRSDGELLGAIDSVVRVRGSKSEADLTRYLEEQMQAGVTLSHSPSLNLPKATSASSGILGAIGNIFGSLRHVFSGIGGGFSVGSALGNIGGGRYGNMGSIIGATAGTAIGLAIFPGVGTVIGGLFGGAAGGLFGGLFGHRKNPYTIAQVQAGPDGFSVGKVWNQAQTDNITGPLRKDIDRLNTQFARLGIRVGGGYIGAVRDDRNNKDPMLKNVALVDIIKNATLTSGNATFNQALRQGLTGNYGDLNDYMSTITQLKNMAKVVDDLKAQFDTISTFVNTSMPDLLKALTSGQKMWVDQMAALKKTYEDAAQQADSYGLDGGALRQKYESLYDQNKAAQEGTLSQNANTRKGALSERDRR
ncbi:MAG: hypothetical protein AAYR33_08170 [Acetobacteraceae bacterium]